MGFRRKVLYALSLIFLLVFLGILACFVAIVAVLETVTVVVLGFLLGLILNKYPEWAKTKITKAIARLYKRYSRWLVWH